ncbi:hypothetical protein HYT59_00260 [Candidatus Woesebacteria bacterium]|nr:hypothetical protein [Candidatus Woesebacteria bacterium]
MHFTIWKDISNKYKGNWIALTSDEKDVVASGKVASKVYKEARDKGIKVPILYKVPTISAPYIGRVW